MHLRFALWSESLISWICQGSLSSPPSSVADTEHNFAAFLSYPPRYQNHKRHDVGIWPWQAVFPGVGAHCLTEVSFYHCSLLPPYKIQYCELANANHQCRLAQLAEKGRATFPFFPSRPPLPLPFLPFPTVAISNLLTPSWRYGQRSLKCQQSSSLFPTVSLKGKQQLWERALSTLAHRVTAHVRNAQRQAQSWGGHGYTAPAWSH